VKIEQRRGSVHHPLAAAEIERKFRRLAATFLPVSAIDELIGVVGNIEREVDLTRLTTLITIGGV
jgi:hypothetical protein